MRTGWTRRCVWMAVAGCFAAMLPAGDAAADIDLDEVVILFPTYASLDSERGVWRAHLHAWVFEPEEDDSSRGLLLNAFADVLNLEAADDEEWRRYARRAWGFIVDNERGQTFDVLMADQTFELGPTRPNGHARAVVDVPTEPTEEVEDDEAAAAPDDAGVLTPRVDLPFWDDRTFSGWVELIGPRGVSVISDIDDTIKVSEVQNTEALLQRTFKLPHEPVEGMAALYQRWESKGAEFHYVTASPWQLYPMLVEFLGAEGFPRGSMHMKSVRLKDRTVFELFKASGPIKQRHIERILADFPERRFILVGDSAEEDPETFAAVARTHPEQVAAVLIRNVTDEGPEAGRYAETFAGLDGSLWRIFDDPAEIGGLDAFDEQPR